MTVAALLQRFHERGFHIDVAGGRLLVSPASRLTIHDRSDIVESVSALIMLVEDEREWLDERAGIMEYEGGMTRSEAEAAARTLIANVRRKHADD